MRRKIVGASWKMHKNTIDEVKSFVNTIKEAPVFNKVESFLMPSFVFIPLLEAELTQSPIGWGSQTMAFEDYGAYTGEVSVLALKEYNVSYVEIGHAERREHFNETDEVINKKIKLTLAHDMVPVVCVGETKLEKDEGRGDDSIKHQVIMALEGISEAAATKIIFAYEPVWAIGQKEGASAAYVEKQHHLIRGVVSDLYDENTAQQVRIIYGGSVKKESAPQLIQQANVDGLFIGRFGLDPMNFLDIALIVAESDKE